MNQNTKNQAVVAGTVGVVAAGLTLLATSPKARAAVKDCSKKLIESGGSVFKTAKGQGGGLFEIAKGYAAFALGAAQEKLGSLKDHLETKPRKTDEA